MIRGSGAGSTTSSPASSPSVYGQRLLSLVRGMTMTVLPPAEQEAPSLPAIEREQELKDYLWQKFGVKIPEVRVCANHVAPWEVFRAAYFATRPVIVVKGSRGLAGKTFTLGLLGLTEALTLGADVTILGGSGAQSARVHAAMNKLWASPNAPREEVVGEPGVMKTRFRRGNEIEALTASQRSVRGPHPQRLRLDEVDEMDWKIFEAATGQTMAARGILPQTTIGSTHQHPRGTFSKVIKLAQEKGWWVTEWCYRETMEPHGWLLRSEVNRKRDEMTKGMWDTEVELQEPSAEGLAIDPDLVEKMFDARLGQDAGVLGRDVEYETPSPRGAYATGGDWGKFGHHTCTATLRTDTRPMWFMAFYRDRRRPYHLMVPVFNARMKRFPGTGAHDAHGVGNVIDEMMESETEPYTAWAGAARRALFTEYIAAIERGDVMAPRSEPWRAAHRYVTNDDLYADGHPPDEFVACALAYRAHAHPYESEGWRGATW